jgi:hypothetical protein
VLPEYWWPFLYQYGVGAVIFLVGLSLILGYKSCILSRRQDRFWFGVLLVGFLWYAGIHLTWHFLALYVLPTAEAGGSGG